MLNWTMIKQFLCVILIAFMQLLMGCNSSNNKALIDDIPSNQVTLEDGSYMLFEQDMQVPMRDGVNLSVNIFRPVEEGQYPVIMAMTPYDKNWLDVEYSPEEGDINVSKWATFEQPDPAFWVAKGYVVIAADCRGIKLSEGDVRLLTNAEADDYYDLIEWAGQASWSNGNVGLNGVSYMAINQWKVAELAPPHLKAIMPWEGFTDIYRDFAFHGGIGGNRFLQDWWQYRILENMNPDSALQGLPELLDTEPLLTDVYKNHGLANLASIDIPAYVVASWPDQGLHTRGTIEGFKQISSEQKWLEIHGRKKLEWYYSEPAQQRQLAFFDHFLANKATNINELPKVWYERRDVYYQGQMIAADNWPIPEHKVSTLYLDAEYLQMSEQVSDKQWQVEYTTDDDFELVTDNEKSLFSYQFSQDTEISGNMALVLYISLEGAQDTDLFVGVQKLDENNQQIYFHGNDFEQGQVANGWLRASHRQLDTSLSRVTQPWLSHDQQQFINSDEIVEVQIEILPSSTRFMAGESINIVVQGSDLVQSGLEHESLSTGKVVIHSGPNTPSRLVFEQVDM